MRLLCSLLLGILGFTQALSQDFGSIFKFQKLSENAGNLNISSEFGAFFGASITEIGDLNEDGITDLAVGASLNNEVYILFLDKQGRVKDQQIIGSNKGGFNESFGFRTRFGASLANVGDLNEDGNNEILVGEPLANYGGAEKGGSWLIFLKSNGKVKDYKQFSDTTSGFNINISQEDRFGGSLADIGDLNKDGINEFAIGAPNRDGGKGVFWIFFPDSGGKVNEFEKISYTDLSINNNNRTSFGASITGIKDVNNDDVPDIIVGADGDDDGGQFKGAVWVIFLNRNGTLKAQQKISEIEGGFNDTLNENANFGSAVTNLGDINGDDVKDIAVGAIGYEYADSSADNLAGKVWILFLNKDGTVKSTNPIGNNSGNFPDSLRNNDRFGATLTKIEDLNGDTIPELGVGAFGDNDGGQDAGAAYILFLNGVPQTPEDTSSGLEPNKPFKRLNTYPNPVTQSQDLTLSLPSNLPKGQRGKITLFDIEGQLVYEESFTYQGQPEKQLAVPEVAPGSYQLFLRAGDFQGFSRVVVGGGR